jgi:hypothetical protein
LEKQPCKNSNLFIHFLFFHKQRFGKGILISADGSKYDGQFKNDKKHGKGVLTDFTGKYDGPFVDDKVKRIII